MNFGAAMDDEPPVGGAQRLRGPGTRRAAGNTFGLDTNRAKGPQAQSNNTALERMRNNQANRYKENEKREKKAAKAALQSHQNTKKNQGGGQMLGLSIGGSN